MFGVLAELNARNQTVSHPEPSPSAVPQKLLVHVIGTQSSNSLSEEDDSGCDDKATDRSTSVVPDSQPSTPPSNQAAIGHARAHL